jgi:hypothetical protein
MVGIVPTDGIFQPTLACAFQPSRQTLLQSVVQEVFEFQMVELVLEGATLQQTIHLIGVEFSNAGRNIVGFGVESL